MRPALCVAVVGMLFAVPLAHAECSHDTVFLTLGDQIRGYSARANGATEPCQLLQGPLTTLMSAGGRQSTKRMPSTLRSSATMQSTSFRATPRAISHPVARSRCR